MVKLNPYMYPAYLKELAKYKLEDSERLSPPVRQQPRVRQASMDSFKTRTLCWTDVLKFKVSYPALSLSMYLYVLRRVLDSQLCMKNYTERFHLLLHLEEIQMEVDIKKYDLYGKTMTLDKSNKKLLILKVSEKHNYLTPDVFLFMPDGLNF